MNTGLTLERPGFEVGKSDENKNKAKDAGSPSERSAQSSGNRSPYKMPSYTTMSDSPSVAAGVPVLELVRKFEDEKILTRDDRVALNEALYNPERREGVVKAMKEVELGGNTRFTIRRLKALIHQNGTGEVSSKKLKEQRERGSLDALMTPLVEAQLSARGEGKERRNLYSPRTQAAIDAQKKQLQDDKESGDNKNRQKSAPKKGGASPSTRSTSRQQHSEAGSSPGRRRRTNHDGGNGNGNGSRFGGGSIADSVRESVNETQEKIGQVVGSAPTYVPMDHFNVCQKIVGRLRDFLVKYKPSAMGVRKFAVLVGTFYCLPPSLLICLFICLSTSLLSFTHHHRMHDLSLTIIFLLLLPTNL
jgi:hypothetical protein